MIDAVNGIADSCYIAMVLQPFSINRGNPRITPQSQNRWADVGRQLERMLPCIRENRETLPTGGYTPYASESSLESDGAPPSN